ncbi:MAG: IS66 family insertion sequence element accessory protein TnpA, partial [Steroidobacteraceae bacterium]
IQHSDERLTWLLSHDGRAGMKRRTIEAWQALFEAQARSGLTVAAFCRGQGLNPTYFSLKRRQWQGRSVSRPADPARSTFVPVTVRGRDEGLTVMELRVGPALSLRLPTSVAPAWLAELLCALRG